MTKVKKTAIYVAIIIILVGCVGIFRGKLFQKSNEPTNTVSKISVEVQSVKFQEKNAGDMYKSTLEPYKLAVITSKVSAKVQSVSVENGQYVNAGDTIAVLDGQDMRNSLKTAQAQLQISQQQLNSSQLSMEKYKINLDDAQNNYNRQKALYDGNVIAKVELEAAEKALNNARVDYNSGLSAVETAKANLNLQNITISNYQDSLNNTVIKAPISGVVSEKSLNIGQMASPGAVLAKINDISSIYAVIQVPQDKISSIKIGQEAEITVNGSEEPLKGTVQNMDSTADAAARIFTCKIKFENSSKALLPGTYAKVKVLNGQKAQVVVVPIKALSGSENNYSVFINKNGTAKKQKVAIGDIDENSVIITSGIKDGDQIICSNVSSLQDGDSVEAASN